MQNGFFVASTADNNSSDNSGSAAATTASYNYSWDFTGTDISAITSYSKTKITAAVDLGNGLALTGTSSSHTYASGKGLTIKGDDQMELSGITGKVTVTLVAYMNSDDTTGRTITITSGSDTVTTKSLTAKKDTDTISLTTTVSDGKIVFSSVGEVYVSSIKCVSAN